MYYQLSRSKVKLEISFRKIKFMISNCRYQNKKHLFIINNYHLNRGIKMIIHLSKTKKKMKNKILWNSKFNFINHQTMNILVYSILTIRRK
jgi:hypothetical protein